MHLRRATVANVISILVIVSTPPQAMSAADERAVTTIAGNGAPGYADGPASGPAFMMPVAVAAAADGSLVVVDRAAQRLRRVANGNVTTIAGSGLEGEHVGQVTGGFRDGPALLAQFDEPTGIAIGRDGSMYVSDEFNHCIRKISHGVVSTYAGSHDRAGKDDGPATSATFQRPSAIAIASDGTIFVADYGVGIRELTTEGNVVTLAQPQPGSELAYVGVAVAGSGLDETIVATEDIGLTYVFNPNSHRSIVFNGAEGGIDARLYGIVAVNPFEFLATDLRSNAVRQLRLQDLPYVSQPSSELIAGAPVLEAHDGGSFANGPLLDSHFYEPIGITISGASVIVCDTGNRRLRALPVPDVRRPVGSNIAELRADATAYRILMVGASHTFWATTWPASIPGLIESDLVRDKSSIGLRKTPRVSVARIDGANLDEMANYVLGYAADTKIDLVLLTLRSPDLASIPARDGETKSAAQIRVLSNLEAMLATHGTRLVVDVRPLAADVSPGDQIFARDHDPNSVRDSARRSIERETRATLTASGVDFSIDFNPYVDYENRIDKLPLWAFDDYHENANGRRFAATNIVKALETLKPWAKN